MYTHVIADRRSAMQSGLSAVEAAVAVPASPGLPPPQATGADQQAPQQRPLKRRSGVDPTAGAGADFEPASWKPGQSHWHPGASLCSQAMPLVQRGGRHADAVHDRTTPTLAESVRGGDSPNPKPCWVARRLWCKNCAYHRRGTG